MLATVGIGGSLTDSNPRRRTARGRRASRPRLIEAEEYRKKALRGDGSGPEPRDQRCAAWDDQLSRPPAAATRRGGRFRSRGSQENGRKRGSRNAREPLRF